MKSLFDEIDYLGFHKEDDELSMTVNDGVGFIDEVKAEDVRKMYLFLKEYYETPEPIMYEGD